jgi:hypothetical protein
MKGSTGVEVPVVSHGGLEKSDYSRHDVVGMMQANRNTLVCGAGWSRGSQRERKIVISTRGTERGGGFRHLFDEGRWAGKIDQRASLLDRAVVKGAVGLVGHRLYAECLGPGSPERECLE